MLRTLPKSSIHITAASGTKNDTQKIREWLRQISQEILVTECN